MKAIILGHATAEDKSLFDVRYFYRIDNDTWRPTCGLALKTLVAVHRRHDDSTIQDIGAWYQAVSNSPNVTVLGFLVERVCLDAIQRGALKVVDKRLGQSLKRYTFQGTPSVETLIADKQPHCLYVPSHFNFPNIDAAAIWLDHKEQKAHVYPIQVSVARTHQDSERCFYQSQWQNWKVEFPDEYDVSSTFLWVGMKPASNEDKWMVTRSTRSRPVVVDDRTSRRISIEEVDSTLYSYVKKRLLSWN